MKDKTVLYSILTGVVLMAVCLVIVFSDHLEKREPVQPLGNKKESTCFASYSQKQPGCK